MKENLKVLFFTAWYPNKNSSLAGTFVREHAKALKPSVKTLAVFHVFSDEDLKVLFKFIQTEDCGVTLYRISHKKFVGILSSLNWILYPVASVLGFYKTYKAFGKADIHHVHVLTRTGILPLISKHLFKVPYVITEHWTRYLPSRNAYHGLFRAWITRYIVNQSSGLSTVSSDLLNAMKSHGLKHQNSMLISNTVANQYFNTANIRQNREFKFIHVSGIQDASKNISGILRVVKRLKKSGLKFKLDIVGDDKERSGFEEYCKQVMIDDVVTFHGKLYDQKLIKKYQENDAFVLFSNFENQPCVILESFASGLPVISTNVGGIAEIVDSSNGILIDSKDENALFEAMKDLILQNKKFDNDLIQKNAQQKYSYKAIADKFLELYQTVLN